AEEDSHRREELRIPAPHEPEGERHDQEREARAHAGRGAPEGRQTRGCGEPQPHQGVGGDQAVRDPMLAQVPTDGEAEEARENRRRHAVHRPVPSGSPLGPEGWKLEPCARPGADQLAAPIELPRLLNVPLVLPPSSVIAATTTMAITS